MTDYLDDNQINIKRNKDTQVIYIEPNSCNLYNFQNKNGEEIDIAPNLEDYSIYVDLQVELVSRTNESSTKVINVMYTSNANEQGSIRMMQGSYYGTIDNINPISALTTTYSDVGYKELIENERNIEYFGINSININYDPSLCPTVDIEFTDIRGISLFSVEEITHSQTDNNGTTGKVNNDQNIADSFFASFFKFPYPKFILYVKGFYGEPVAYDLAVNNFKTTFDSKTGNFGASVSFVSYRYGVLNDLTMTTLASAVASKEGSEYWKNQVDAGRFKYNGEDLITIGEIALQYHNYEVEVEEQTKDVSDSEDIIAELGEASNRLSELFNTYFSSVESTAKQMVSSYSAHCDTFLKKFFAKENITSLKRIFNKRNEQEINSFFDKAKEQLYKKNSEEISYVYNSNTKTIDFCVPDNASQLLVNDNVIKPDYFIINAITNKQKIEFRSHENISSIRSNIISDFSDFEKGKHYISKFGENRMPSYMIYDNYSKTYQKKIEGKYFKSSILNPSNSFKTNREIAESNNVGTNFNALITEIQTISSQTTNTDVQTLLTDLYTHLYSDTALYLCTPKINECAIVPMHIESIVNSNIGSSGCNSLVKMPSSHYTLNFSKVIEILDKLNVKTETAQKTSEQIENLAADRNLTFKTGIRYITKCLWAHVETFLHLCIETNEKIRANSNRTAEKMGLTENNSNLPSKYYQANNGNLVGAFPVILKKNDVPSNSSNNSDLNNKREIYGYLGDIYPDAEESRLVENLMTGPAQIYTTIHADKNVNTNQTSNEFKLAEYLYLKQIFDKWIHGIKSTDFLNQFGIDKYFDTHFLFIDTYYNVIDDEMGINSKKFAKACYDIFADDNKNNTLLSFMWSYMQEVNAILQPTQGFMLNEIDNKDNIEEYYKKIFLPIPFNQMKVPEPSPYFVVIWRGDPSQNLNFKNDNMDDSFLISENQDSLITKLPMGLINRVLFEGEGENKKRKAYPIPAIGVSYGRQYQNYFMDISIDTSKPMANEIVIAAQYNLVGASTSDGTSSNQQSLHFGQDLYTIYANNSYTCTVTMMGCMWIQPLMYFQLNNIPMFRGTYMIQKVTHSIEPGNIITRFTGVRMSRYSSPFVNKFETVLLGGDEAAYQEAKERKASYDNNCPYHFFDPNEVNGQGTNTFPNDWLNDSFEMNYPPSTFPMDYGDFGLSTWYSKVQKLKTKYALASICKFENSEEVAFYVHCALMFNQLNALRTNQNVLRKNGIYGITMKTVWSGHNWSSIRNSSARWSDGRLSKYLNSINDSTIEVKRVTEVFTKSPMVVVGKDTDGNGNNHADERGYTSKHKITKEDLQSLYFTSSNGGSQILLFAHKGSAFYSINNKSGSIKNYHFWEEKVAAPTETSKETKTAFGKRLSDSIQKTFDKYDGFSGDSKTITDFFVVKQDNKSNSFTYVLKNEKEDWSSARLIDILFNVYNKYIISIECSWGASVNAITKETNPTQIVATYTEKDQAVTKIKFVHKKQQIVISEGNFPEDILKVLRKKFTDLKTAKANTYIVNNFA